MNHCHNCNSDYDRPGTCNCYAPQQGTYTPPAIDVKPVPMPMPYAPIPGTTWMPYESPPNTTPAVPYTITVTCDGNSGGISPATMISNVATHVFAKHASRRPSLLI